MTYQDMVDYIKSYYSKPTRIINVSKYSDFVSDMTFNKVDINRDFRQVDEPSDVVYELNNDFADKTSIICVGKLVEDDFNYVNFICSMLAGGLQSPLYQEVREKRGLSYGVGCDVSRVHNKGILSISVQTSNENVEEVVSAIKLVIDNPDTYLTQERFDIVKNSHLISLKKSEINRYKSVGEYINPAEWNTKNIIETITLDDVKRVYNKYFKFEDMHISSDKKEFVTVTV